MGGTVDRVGFAGVKQKHMGRGRQGDEKEMGRKGDSDQTQNYGASRNGEQTAILQVQANESLGGSRSPLQEIPGQKSTCRWRWFLLV